ncbi:hypothetical protein ACSBR1_038495 [Camellia fascicularis]
MASSLALRRATASALFNRLVNPLRSVSVARSFSTNAQIAKHDGDDRSVDVERRPGRSIFPDVLDPFSPTRSLSQLLNLMDQFMENPFLATSQGIGAGARRGWDVKEDDKALYLRMDMPGLDKEDVKISVEYNTLIIKGEGKKESEDEEVVQRYSSRLDLPPNLHNIDEIKAEMKNGVLKIVVPKVKEEEREDVRQVKID